MTVEQHNKTLGVLHLVYVGLHLLGLFLVAAYFFVNGIGKVPLDLSGPDSFFFVYMMTGAILMTLFSMPSLLVGYGLLKRKPWAKTLLVFSGITAMNVLIGAPLGAYSLWFIFGKGGHYYRQPSEAYALWGFRPSRNPKNKR